MQLRRTLYSHLGATDTRREMGDTCLAPSAIQRRVSPAEVGVEDEWCALIGWLVNRGRRLAAPSNVLLGGLGPTEATAQSLLRAAWLAEN
jgi:hypothetical protein